MLTKIVKSDCNFVSAPKDVALFAGLDDFC